MVLASLDPGVDWVLVQLGTDRRGLLQDLERTFPPPQRSSIGPADLASFVAP
jgi:hypothetical protein